jgi:hypothetical protein
MRLVLRQTGIESMFQLNNEMMNAIPMIATRKFPSPTYGIVGPLGLPKSLQPSHLIP